MSNRVKGQLGRRILIRSVSLLLVVLVGVVFLELRLSTQRVVAESHSDLVRRINTIEPYIVQALWSVDTESVRIAVQSIGASPGVAHATLRAQFRINDIHERFVREGAETLNCSESIIRDYASVKYQGLEVGSGVLNICFSEELVKAQTVPNIVEGSLIKYFMIAAVTALILFLIISRSVIRPLDQIIAHVQEDALLTRTPLERDFWDRNDEIDQLYHELVEKEVAVERTHENDKLRMLGILAGGVAHDFNNVLAIIAGNAELMRIGPADDPEAFDARRRTLLNAVQTGSAMTRRLQLLSDKGSKNLVVTGLSEIWTNVRSFVGLLIERPAGALQVSFELDTDGQILVDPGGLEAALLNLVLNARDAITNGNGGKIRIVARDQTNDNKNEVIIRVEDNGQGIAPEHLARVTDPFFTTKAAGSGSGLGLAMVSEFVQRCGGRIEIESEPGQGTAVSLFFPTVATSMTTVETASLAPVGLANYDSSRPKLRILVIDDNRDLAESVSDQLKSIGYQSGFATDALRLMNDAESVAKYDVIVSDVLLGPTSGLELYRHFKSSLGERCPLVVFISGAVPDSFAYHIQSDLEKQILFKPFHLQSLDRQILETWESHQESRDIRVTNAN